MNEVRMPFGKYKNRLLRHCDTSYLVWVVARTSHEESLDIAIRAELVRRHAHGYTSQEWKGLPAGVTIDTALQLIEAGRRNLAKSLHPDKGGNHSNMVAVNVTADWLEVRLRDLFQGEERG